MPLGLCQTSWIGQYSRMSLSGRPDCSTAWQRAMYAFSAGTSRQIEFRGFISVEA